MAEWQPIETAPVDGTAVLVWDSNIRNIRVLAWREGRVWTCNGYFREPSAYEFRDGWPKSPKNLTHWMPSPSPRQQETTMSDAPKNDALPPLSAWEAKTIEAWRGMELGCAVFFRAIPELTGVPANKVRRHVRALARKGYLKFIGAVFNEDDGLIAGSGYGLTKPGLYYLRARTGDDDE